MSGADSYTVTNRSFTLDCKNNCLFPVEIINLVARLKCLSEFIKLCKAVFLCKLKCRCGKFPFRLIFKEEFFVSLAEIVASLKLFIAHKIYAVFFFVKKLFLQFFCFFAHFYHLSENYFY